MSGAAEPAYEVLAIRYGTSTTTRGRCFHRYGSYGEADAEQQLDFFVWVIRNEERTILVDSGFHVDALRRRPGRTCLAPVPEALAAVGVDPGAVSELVITHLHYDHTGNLAAFPNARIHLQQRELDFWTGPYAGHPPQAELTEQRDIEFVRRAVERGRVELVDGTADVAPGVRVRRVGGHCPGQQIVLVRGEPEVLLASDAVHFYDEIDRDRPYENFTDLTEMYETYAELRRMREQGAVVVAGHDPLVMQRFPSAGPDCAVRIVPPDSAGPRRQQSRPTTRERKSPC